jgi:LysW-gamma-L-lysine carboxypeptidase
MIELLEQCVRIPSLSGEERLVADFMCREMAARGFDRTFVDDAGNAVGIVGCGSRQIVLLGHMDTVGGEVPVRYVDGKLYGRGSVDAKGPLCAFVLAAARLAGMSDGNGLLGNWQVVVVGAVEEESASSRGARFAASQYHPELCVIGEPSGSDGITLGYKGRLLAHARVEQSVQHTAMPGPSASERAVNLWNDTKAFADSFNTGKSRAFDQVLPSLRRIQTGDDGLREWCEMFIGIRLPEAVDPADMQARIEAIGARLAGGETGADVGPGLPAARPTLRLGFTGHERAYRTANDTPLARAFVDAIRAQAMRPAFKLKTGTADFNVVGPAWNCPMVAYGPGDSSLDHTPDEHVAIDEFEKAVKVLTIVLTTLTRQ